MLLLPATAARRMPWKNGAGFTTVLATDADVWSWRLAIADVPSRAAFSPYPDVDRQLSLLEGEGLWLEIDGARCRAPREGHAVAFRGEARVIGEPVGDGVRDVNLMVRRGIWRGALQMLATGATDVTGDVVVVHAIGGAISVSSEAAMTTVPGGATLLTTGCANVRCDGGATAAIATMQAAQG